MVFYGESISLNLIIISLVFDLIWHNLYWSSSTMGRRLKEWETIDGVAPVSVEKIEEFDGDIGWAASCRQNVAIPLAIWAIEKLETSSIGDIDAVGLDWTGTVGTCSRIETKGLDGQMFALMVRFLINERRKSQVIFIFLLSARGHCHSSSIDLDGVGMRYIGWSGIWRRTWGRRFRQSEKGKTKGEFDPRSRHDVLGNDCRVSKSTDFSRGRCDILYPFWAVISHMKGNPDAGSVALGDLISVLSLASSFLLIIVYIRAKWGMISRESILGMRSVSGNVTPLSNISYMYPWLFGWSRSPHPKHGAIFSSKTPPWLVNFSSFSWVPKIAFEGNKDASHELTGLKGSSDE